MGEIVKKSAIIELAYVVYLFTKMYQTCPCIVKDHF